MTFSVEQTDCPRMLAHHFTDYRYGRTGEMLKDRPWRNQR
jgi:hypothetical protein